mmetsp:Transcript_70635/g.133220  ORF Transcript_70635/g.133220 Transcript_70635/m.133220 type:complete len:434 (-) Transcript_70635:119-1420(-)
MFRRLGVQCKQAVATCQRSSFAGQKGKSSFAGAASIKFQQTGLDLQWHTGEQFSLNPNFLRERCQSDTMVDPATKQPTGNPHDFPEDLKFTNATMLNEDLLEVSFNDGHVSRFDTGRLHAELVNFRDSPMQVEQYQRPALKLWSGDFVPSQYDYNDIKENPETQFKIISDLLTSGAALVSNVPQESGAVCKFGQMLSTLRETDWGPCFNVRTKPDADQGGAGGVKKDLAYTPKPIGFHTDNPYRWPTPDFQLLHAIEHCTCPGEAPCAECSVLNYMVDGFYIAELLKQESPEAFELLSTIPVRFENNGGDGGSALVHVAPHFELEQGATQEGRRLQALRFSAKSGQYSPPMEKDVAAAFYKARRRFSELAHDSKHTNTMQFKPGDCVVFDNQRILHARSEILPTDGERWVQGCYIDRDGLWLNYERYRRKFLY